VRDFRVELLSESPAEGVKLVDLYLRLLQRRVSPEEVWRTLKAANRIGVTRGTLEDRPEQLDRTLVQIVSRRDS
jgi:putative protease